MYNQPQILTYSVFAEHFTGLWGLNKSVETMGPIYMFLKCREQAHLESARPHFVSLHTRFSPYWYVDTNPRLTTNSCCVSFLWSQLLSEIEEHLKCTITQCEPDIKVPVDDFDGKVTYGQRRALGGTWWRVITDCIIITLAALTLGIITCTGNYPLVYSVLLS